MVRFGLDSFSYHLHLEDLDHPRDALWFVRQVSKLGLDGCHIDPRHLQGWDEDLVRAIGMSCEEHGLYLELGSGGFDYERLSRRLELAAQVGARMVRTFIGGERHKVPEERRKELMGYAVENFKRLAEVAERVGVPLGLENHEDLTSAEVIAILDEVGSDFIGACVDTGNSLPVWEDPVACVRALAPYAVGTHLKDWKFWWEEGIPKSEGCPLGQGDACVADVYPILRKAKPEMPITMELVTISADRVVLSLEDEQRIVDESIAFARELEKQFEAGAG